MTNSAKSSCALYADDEGNVVVRKLSLPAPRDDELLIQVLYSGVNPSDFKTLRFFNCRNRVLGNEFCGKVLDSPAVGRFPFFPGDIVAGYVDSDKNRPDRYGTHQEYISVPPDWVYRLPCILPPPNAATLTIVTQTANDALFNRFGIPTPYEVTGPTEGTLVVWGGATSVGMAAIQLARASRVTTIVATASPKRHEFLRSLGATHCFDYADKNVADKIKAVLDGSGSGPIWGFDAIGTVDSPDSQTLLYKSLPREDRVRLVTVLLMGHDGFEPCVGARHLDISFDLPDGGQIVINRNMREADRMWKALEWVVHHYGREYKETPLRVFRGSAKDALREVEQVDKLGPFGKLALELPWVDTE